MSRDGPVVVALGLVVVAVLVVAGLGAFGTTTVTTSSSSSATAVAIPDPPSDGSTGVVFSAREQGGQSLFGIPLTADKYFVHVGLVVPEDCVVTDDQGMEKLSEAGDCADLRRAAR